ncbi:MAG: hypothetical protein KF886_22030 [Candidatus Hydrogenedentes bacterium]|nr:hypothetical protein [Candidatus Hydrogenedentota bacterium]
MEHLQRLAEPEEGSARSRISPTTSASKSARTRTTRAHIVLISDAASGGTRWEAVIAELANRGYAATPLALTGADSTEAIVRAIDALPSSPVLLAGLGIPIDMLARAANRRPGRVESLVLIGGGAAVSGEVPAGLRTSRVILAGDPSPAPAHPWRQAIFVNAGKDAPDAAPRALAAAIALLA